MIMTGVSYFVGRPSVQPYDRLLPAGTYLIAQRTTEERQLVSVEQMVRDLRTRGMPVSALAEIFNVERKTIYAWLDGSVARESHHERVSSIFRMFRGINLSALYRTWNRKLDHGSSLRQLLSADPLSDLAVKDALTILAPTVSRYESLPIPANSSRGKARNPFLDEVPEATTAG